jgi:hypothetical protein
VKRDKCHLFYLVYYLPIDKTISCGNIYIDLKTRGKTMRMTKKLKVKMMEQSIFLKSFDYHVRTVCNDIDHCMFVVNHEIMESEKPLPFKSKHNGLIHFVTSNGIVPFFKAIPMTNGKFQLLEFTDNAYDAFEQSENNPYRS